VKRRKWTGYVKGKYPVSSSLHPFNFFVPIVDRVKNGVVSIVTEDHPFTQNVEKLIRDLLTNEIPIDGNSERSYGSGFIFHPGGYILTSEHVVSKSKKILVKLSNGRVFEAKRVLSDRTRDFAVLKIEADCKLHPLTLGNSAETKVGEWVISIGSPPLCIGQHLQSVAVRYGLRVPFLLFQQGKGILQRLFNRFFIFVR
jgi:S1-C subfamily serine protease